MEAGAATSAEQVVTSYFDAISRRNLDEMVTFYSPEMVVDLTSQGVFRGPVEWRKFFAGVFEAIPDLEMIVDRIVGGDGVAVVQWRMRGNFTGGPLMGIEPTNAWLEMRGCDVIEVSDGLIVRNTAFQDGMELARSIGMMPPMDSGAEKAMIQAFNLATKARRALRERFGG